MEENKEILNEKQNVQEKKEVKENKKINTFLDSVKKDVLKNINAFVNDDAKSRYVKNSDIESFNQKMKDGFPFYSLHKV